MRHARASTIYDSLRIEPSRGGFISPALQSERAPAANSFYAGEDTSGIGQAATTARSSRTHTAGDLSPQGYLRAPAVLGDIASDAGKLNNAPKSGPNRGVEPRRGASGGGRGGTSDRRRRTSPLAKRA